MRGYRVFYKAIAKANKKLDDGVIQTRSVAVNSSTLAVVLENLSAFTRYEIEVLAFTIKGNGVRSKALRAGIDLSLNDAVSQHGVSGNVPARTAIPTEKHKVTSILEFDKSKKEFHQINLKCSKTFTGTTTRKAPAVECYICIENAVIFQMCRGHFVIIVTSISGLGLRHLNDVQFKKKTETLCKAFKSQLASTFLHF